MFKRASKSSVGSVYLEMLIAFFGWLILLGTVLPAFFHIQMERKALLVDNEAQMILAEQLIKWTQGEPFDEERPGNYADVYAIKIVPEGETQAICVIYPKPGVHEGEICQPLPD